MVSRSSSNHRHRRVVVARHAPADDELVADTDTTSALIYSAPDGSKEAEVLEKLRRVIDPDFGETSSTAA